MSKYSVKADAPTMIATVDTVNDMYLYNMGPNDVYIGEDTSLGGDPTGRMLLPVETQRVVDAGTPIWLMCSTGTATVAITSVGGTLPVEPVSQAQITLAQNSYTIFDATDKISGPYDMRRYKSFSLRRFEVGNTGTEQRNLVLWWVADDPNLGAPAVPGYSADLNVIEMEDMILWSQESDFYCQGEVKAPYLIIQEAPTLSGIDCTVDIHLRGYVKRVLKEVRRLDSLLGNNLVADGRRGYFSLRTSVPIATNATVIERPNIYGNRPYTFTLQARTNLAAGSPLRAQIQDWGGNLIGGLSIPAGSPAATTVSTSPLYLPAQAISISITNFNANAIDATLSGVTHL